MPKAFFRITSGLDQDMPSELANRIQGKPWPSVSLMDWQMVGSGPASWREYLWPKTFAYYVPSVLVGALAKPTFPDLALEAILPFNRQHRPRGDWWFSFAGSFSDVQKKAIRGFLISLRAISPKDLDLQDDELVSAAEMIWF
ncbi:MAG: hypothetical protein GC203_19180 [Phenylobacterium sp.]|uniref:hypothetical protein n=1 Tax=Phenylobacterium sp. TaxID=1871053 RepID=UPI0025CFFAA0|nr:hypothetical protein [Phenylobacterium sp.]MBI1199986.1 hypothetical protein [Phenylobacterium sp.]